MSEIDKLLEVLDEDPTKVIWTEDHSGERWVETVSGEEVVLPGIKELLAALREQRAEIERLRQRARAAEAESERLRKLVESMVPDVYAAWLAAKGESGQSAPPIGEDLDD